MPRIPMNTLNIISNRLPITLSKRGDELEYQASAGGLATGLASLCEGDMQCQWIGWPGIAAENLTVLQKNEVEKTLAESNNIPIFLTREDMDNYYRGFCNETLWPLFHYFTSYAKYDNAYWKAYERVNRAFRDKVLDNCSPEGNLWIHDYHLMLLPAMVREVWPQAQIGFFLHIPFPSFEIFRLLPWRHEILKGLLGADLIGFHTHDYIRHFLSSVSRLENIRHYMDTLDVNGRQLKVDAFPMGIDYEKYSGAASDPKVEKRMFSIRSEIGSRKVIASIDRLDYTKGIIQRLEAFDEFLAQHPQYKEKVTMILLAVPSRTSVGDYAELRRGLDRLVGRVNGTHGTIGWVPVWYLYRFEPFEKLVAIYKIADVALVTPMRDGMNLIAKEYVAANTDGEGVLILSEMAGAASELGEALTVNANNKQAVVDALKLALEMPEDEKRERMRSMQARLRQYDIRRWARDFMSALTALLEKRARNAAATLSREMTEEILNSYKKGSRNLIIFDYDERIADKLRQTGIDDSYEKIRECLRSVVSKPSNEIVFISNLDRETLEGWLGDVNVTLVAEHGAWIKEKSGDWQMIEPLRTDWKATIRPILEMYTARSPGSSVREKEYSLIWHHGESGTDSFHQRKQELWDAISGLVEHLDIEVIQRKSTIEVINTGVRKNQVARLWIGRRKWDFIMGISTDVSGDDLFLGFPENSYSMQLGSGSSSARIHVSSVTDLMSLFEAFAS